MRLFGILLALVLLSLAPARAEERILHFDSNLLVQADGAFEVTETIRVLSEADQIRRGIFRDFPMLVSENGVNHRVGLEVTGAWHDGRPTPFRIIEDARAARIYLGDPDGYLEPGEHEYVLTYRTDRQMRFFDDHDEVYWNATGTEWLFPIDRATATIRLPGGISARQTTFFTGPFGATGKAARLVEDTGSTIRFETTAPLAAREGLTVAVSLPKGAIPPPDQSQQRAWFRRDNDAGLRALAAAVAAFAGYLLIWWKFGRDARPGILVYRWEPPKGLSAPMTRAATKGEAPPRSEGLSLALVELVSLKLVAMTQQDGTATLTRTKTTAPTDLSPDLRLVLDRIAANPDQRLVIDRSDGKTIEKLQDDLHVKLRQILRAKRLWRSSGWWKFMALLVNAPLIGYLPFLAPYSLRGTLLPLIPVALFLLIVLRGMFWTWRDDRRIGAKIYALFGIAVLGSLAIFLVILHLRQGGTLLMPLALCALLAVNVVFMPILGGVTPAGRWTLDQIAGLRDYIEIAEKDRLNLEGVPDMSVAHFERILPYAMALDLETAWVQRFNAWLAAASPPPELSGLARLETQLERSAIAERYQTGSRAASMPSLQRQLASGLTAALPIALASSSAFSSDSGSSGSSSGGSSGSSSGGSSGGGGGGGGGGGW